MRLVGCGRRLDISSHGDPVPSVPLTRPIDATLSVTKAARLLGVHPNTIRAWSDAGRLLSEARLGELRKAICSKYEIEFIELKKRRALIPEIAQPLRSALDAPALQPEPTRKVRSPTTHEKKIWQVSQRGLEGDQYLRELHTAGARPRQSWIQRGCPGTYAGIAAERDPKWLQRAADEKSKVCKKLELLSH